MSQQNQALYEFGAFRLDAQKRTLQRDGEVVALAPKAFDMLLVLIRHHGEVLDKERLMNLLWPDSEVEEANLPQNISALRKALGESPNERKYIITVSGRGYKFAAEVKEVSEAREVVLERYSKATIVVEEQEEHQESVAEELPKLLPAPKPPTRPWRASRGLLALFLIGAAVVITALYVAVFHKPKEASPRTAIQSFAVLPFKLLSAESDDEYLGLGMADTLITKLSNLKTVVVRPTSAILKYGNADKNPVEAGRELAVEAVLEGSIQKAGDRVRVTVRLMRVADGAPLWADKFDEKFTDILALQDAISKRVAESLLVKLGSKESETLARRYTENTEAYELYLKGRFHVFKLTPQGVQQGISYFQQASAIDPTYALAYVGISDAYRALALGAEMLPTETLPKSKAAANKAIEIDDTLSEGHTALGITLFWGDWDWSTAENQFKRALELNPNDPNAHLYYAHLLSNTGRHAEALAQAKYARELVPLFPFGNALEGQFLLHAGRTDELHPQQAAGYQKAVAWFACELRPQAKGMLFRSELRGTNPVEKIREIAENF